MLENERLMRMFGLARKAGRLSYGYETVEALMKENKAKAVFLSSESSERVKRNIKRISEEMRCPVFLIADSMAEIGHAIGSKPTSVVALTDSGFADAARKLIDLPQTDDKEE